MRRSPTTREPALRVSDGVRNQVSEGLLAVAARDTRHQKRKLSVGTKSDDDRARELCEDVSRSMNAFLCCEYQGKI